MTDRLKEIRARLDAATPGQPWVVIHQTFVLPHSPVLVGNEAWQDCIAHAPADIAWLLAEVERLRRDESVVQEATKLECSAPPAPPFADCAPAECTCGMCDAQTLTEAEAVRAIVAERDAAAERVAILRAEVSDLEAELSRVTQ